MDDLATKVGAWSPFILAAIVFVGAFADRLRGTVESGGNAVTSWMQTSRRVQAERRDAEVEALQEQIDGVSAVVKQLQTQVQAHQLTIDALQRDLSSSRSYSWRAWSEIRRLDPVTTFPEPPALPSLGFDRGPYHD